MQFSRAADVGWEMLLPVLEGVSGPLAPPAIEMLQVLSRCSNNIGVGYLHLRQYENAKRAASFEPLADPLQLTSSGAWLFSSAAGSLSAWIMSV